MEIQKIIEDLNLETKSIFYNEPMEKHTSFKIGGPAECYIKIHTIEDIKKILKASKEENIPLTIVGNGTNILVKDSGIKGIVLDIAIKKVQIISDEEKQQIQNVTTLNVGAGNTLGEIAQFAMQNQLSGMEELSGIPGTVGGAIRMNAGAHGREIKDIVKRVTAIDYDGNIIGFTNEQMQFKYRNSIFSNKKYIILEAELQLQEGNKHEIHEKMKEYAIWRKERQPLEYPNAGSTFKRGEDFVTAKLIDECGLKGVKIGGAQISTKHAGFIINAENATAEDVIQLVERAKEEVHNKFGKKIELEIEIIGE